MAWMWPSWLVHKSSLQAPQMDPPDLPHVDSPRPTPPSPTQVAHLLDRMTARLERKIQATTAAEECVRTDVWVRVWCQ